MKLKRLSMHNFMPYKGTAVLEFPQDESRNTLIIFGDNMRGKTSLLNAIRWTFYGYAYGRHLRQIPLHLLPNREAVNEGGRKMETRIEFEANGNQYDLRRVATMKSLVAKPERPEDFQVDSYMQKNGAAIPSNEIEAEINQFAPEQVSRFFLFDGELLQEYEELLIEGSEQGKKIKIEIEKALGVPALTNGRDHLKTIFKQAQKQQSIEASKIKGLEGAAERHQEWVAKRESLEVDLLKLQAMLNEAHNSRLHFDDELEKVEKIYTQKSKLDSYRSRSRDIEEEIKQKTSLRLQLTGQIWRDLLEPRLTLKRDSILQEQQRFNDLNKERNRIQLHIEQTTQYLANLTCPTCGGQSLDASKREAKEVELEQLKLQLREFEADDSKLTDIALQIRALNRVIGHGVGNRISDVDKDLARLEFELSKVENQIEELYEQIKGYDTDAIMKMRSRRDGVIKDEARLSVDVEDRRNKIDAADREIRILSQRMQPDESYRGARGTQMADMCEKLYASFSLSIERLREALRQSVETHASKAFKAMSTQTAYQGLRINENYGLTILDQNGHEVLLRSAGAEQIVALSLIAGLSHAGRPVGPIVMDTPFGRLDTKHRKNILKYLPNSASQLILFVHDGEIRGSDDLNVLAHRIGGQYEIKEVSPTHSILVQR
jgi:DNA sulfur modification protein DndD